MAKETKTEGFLTEEQLEGVRRTNVIKPNSVELAMSNIKEKKEKEEAQDVETAFCGITYYIGKEVAIKRKRHREDEIQSEKLKALKKLFERFIGFECDIKDGQLAPDKKKAVKAEERLTAAQLRQEKNKLSEEISKKVHESDKKYNEELEELRNSYEGQHGRWYSSDWEV